jgi:nucleoid-associated protein YgaU
MKLNSVLLTAGCALLVACVGCEKESAADIARRERADTLRNDARTAEAQGDLVAAEAFYRQLLVVTPSDADVHLSLANLSHDNRKNYLNALYHYQRFLDLQNDSEKAKMVNDRINVARTLYANQVAADIVAREQQALANERNELQAQLSEQQKKIAGLNKQLTDRDGQIEELQGEIKRLNRLIDQLKTIEAETRASHAAQIEQARKELADALEKKPAPANTPTDERVKSIMAEADDILNEVDGGVSKQKDTIDEALREKAEGATDEIPITATPTAGKRYLVRPGDRYAALAREAYGNAAQWRKIRDANRSTTNPDGRLLAGDTILIP